VALETENQTLRTQLNDASGQAAQAKIAGLEGETQAQATQISQLTTQLDASKTAIAELTKRAETAEANETALKAELVTVKAAQKRSDRLAALASKGASPEQSESLVAKFENLTDEQFTEIVNVLSASFPPKDKDKDDDDAEAAKKKAEEEDAKKKSADASQVIDNAQVVNEPAMASASETASRESVRVNTAKFFQRHLKYNANVKLD